MNQPIKIIFEDSDLLIIDKPAGLVVNRSQTATDTLQDWLDNYLKLNGIVKTEENKTFLDRSGLAHRLDKETSGCLVVAKNPESLSKLLAQFKERKVEKEYLALVHGRLEPRRGTIKLPIGRDSFTREKWRVHYSGKGAETSWQVVEYYQHEGQWLTLVSLFPKTGRTHQIRVHMSHLGHPLFADERYLGVKRVKADQLMLNRHFLHATKIKVNHPQTGKRMEFESPLGDDLQRVLDKLSLN
jgi:23S rRNA pseudouridine1911/1915/1917 synthase